MKIEMTRRFEKQYVRLVSRDPHLGTPIQKTLTDLIEFPPAHPSLRLKRIQGSDGIYECSVNMDIRVTFEFSREDVLLLRNIDHHDDALRKP